MTIVTEDTIDEQQPVPLPEEDEVLPQLVIVPARGWAALKLGELWAYRELLLFLTWRDVTVRYKQAVLGVAWAVLQPVFSMVVFTVIFGRLAKLPSDGIPYALFTFVALLPWQLFSGSLTRAGTSLVGSANLITKVYFPRLVIPIASVGACLVDFLISFGVLVLLILWYDRTTTWHFSFGWPLLALPLFVVFALLASLSVALWLSALNVVYRDVQVIIPFLAQAWMYASPVAYSADLVPDGPWHIVYGLNPMAGVIQGFRWALLAGEPPDALMLTSVLVTLLMLLGGLYYFKRMERTFADVV